MNDECLNYQATIEQPIPDEVELIIERGNELSIVVARTGYMLALAKQDYSDRMGSDVMTMLKTVAKQTPMASSRTVNALVASLCHKEKLLVDWIDRINTTATHQIDWCRTLVSKAKQDQYYSRGMNQ